MEGGKNREWREKVERTVYMDNLSTHVTEAVLKTAVGQFGNVKAVRFIPNFLSPGNPPQSALVEMENAKQARAVVSIVGEFPFMISGMPRPVRARPAQSEMFEDRPAPASSRIRCRWVGPADPEFQAVKRLRSLASKHSAEASFMAKQQLAEEAALAQRQHDTLKATFKKYDLVNSVVSDGTSHLLASHYKVNLGDR